ncbi:Protein of unknown function [Amycolatopsis marina]|uniref:DUF4232 domain-containing protein n=1 Tax=Amycolatopsis marina TaxID=490629 RepID=A0A1I0W808_9PSEU|nr:DUF4232 domain-containing protein [Amycolatopsis marina]SFA84842.1 Protein of unknown function [Amycolatopsis marina]
MMRARARQLALAATAAALVAGAAGCGEGTESAEPVSATTESSTSGPSSTPATSPKTESGKSGEASKDDSEVGLCKSADLKLSLGRGDAATGTAHKPLQFTNTSDGPCVIQGFPGVSYVAGEDGHQVGPAAYREGEEGAPVTLKKGEMAHAPVGFVQVRNYEESVCEPQPIRGLRVYPPQETASMFIQFDGTGCASKEIPGNQLVVRTIQPGSGER